jgi:hypothetical protein
MTSYIDVNPRLRHSRNVILKNIADWKDLLVTLRTVSFSSTATALLSNRDKYRCCAIHWFTQWWDISSRDPTVPTRIVPEEFLHSLDTAAYARQLPTPYVPWFGFSNQEQTSLRELLAIFISRQQLNSILAAEPNHSKQLYNLWTLTEKAAAAFRNTEYTGTTRTA